MKFRKVYWKILQDQQLAAHFMSRPSPWPRLQDKSAIKMKVIIVIESTLIGTSSIPASRVMTLK